MMPELTAGLTDEQKLAVNLLDMRKDLNETVGDVKKLNNVVLLGNGELPLREQVRNHQKFVDDMKYWVRLVGGAVILQTITFIAGMTIALIRFLPVLEKIAEKSI